MEAGIVCDGFSVGKSDPVGLLRLSMGIMLRTMWAM
jgi:hypothetical protein